MKNIKVKAFAAMKKMVINKYAILTVVSLLSIFGLGIATFFVDFNGSEATYTPGLKDNAFTVLEKSISSFSSEYNDSFIFTDPLFIRVFGLTEKLVGRTVVEDAGNDEYTVIKNNKNQLQFRYAQKDMSEAASNIAYLREWLSDRDIDMMYINTPTKNMPGLSEPPRSVVDYSNQNADDLLERLKKNKVKTMDFRDILFASGKDLYEAFFVVDHHWTPITAVWAAGVVMERLAEDYPDNFTYDPEIFNLDNYDVEIREKFFLGSQGRRVGDTYMPADDFPIITPRFPTNLTLQRTEPDGKRATLEGDFTSSLTYQSALRDSSYTSRYNYYTGKDYPLVTIDNSLNETGSKILILKDSFVRPMAPFLAMSVDELRMIDMRDFQGNLFEYIEDFNPDIVIVCYNQAYLTNSSAFNFEKNIKY